LFGSASRDVVIVVITLHKRTGDKLRSQYKTENIIILLLYRPDRIVVVVAIIIKYSVRSLLKISGGRDQTQSDIIMERTTNTTTIIINNNTTHTVQYYTLGERL
jgi:hypothetical protein